LYVLQVWKIQCSFMENVKDGDEAIKDVVVLVIVKFEKYWVEYIVVLAFDATLDPRMKLETLAFLFEKNYPLTRELKFRKIKENYISFFF